MAGGGRGAGPGRGHGSLFLFLLAVRRCLDGSSGFFNRAFFSRGRGFRYPGELGGAISSYTDSSLIFRLSLTSIYLFVVFRTESRVVAWLQLIVPGSCVIFQE